MTAATRIDEHQRIQESARKVLSILAVVLLLVQTMMLVFLVAVMKHPAEHRVDSNTTPRTSSYIEKNESTVS